METQATATATKKPTAKQLKQEQQDKAIEYLRSILPAGSVVHTILRHVSASGMSRDISVVVKGPDGIENITHQVAHALGENLKESHGHIAIRVGGCGMDMGFQLVYRLGRRLFPDGFRPIDAGRKYGRNGTPATDIDTDGGYALRQECL